MILPQESWNYTTATWCRVSLERDFWIGLANGVGGGWISAAVFFVWRRVLWNRRNR